MTSPKLMRYAAPRARRSLILPGADSPEVGPGLRLEIAFQVAMSTLDQLVSGAARAEDGRWLMALTDAQRRALLAFIGECRTGKEV